MPWNSLTPGKMCIEWLCRKYNICSINVSAMIMLDCAVLNMSHNPELSSIIGTFADKNLCQVSPCKLLFLVQVRD